MASCTLQSNNKQARPTSWDPPVDLGHLSEAQQEAVRRVLWEKCEAFAYDSDDVGCIPCLKMHITLPSTRHPIPKIQDMLDALGGSLWFSVLDQGKAYHYGFLDEESHPLTAFITHSTNGYAYPLI